MGDRTTSHLIDTVEQLSRSHWAVTGRHLIDSLDLPVPLRKYPWTTAKLWVSIVFFGSIFVRRWRMVARYPYLFKHMPFGDLQAATALILGVLLWALAGTGITDLSSANFTAAVEGTLETCKNCCSTKTFGMFWAFLFALVHRSVCFVLLLLDLWHAAEAGSFQGRWGTRKLDQTLFDLIWISAQDWILQFHAFQIALIAVNFSCLIDLTDFCPHAKVFLHIW